MPTSILTLPAKQQLVQSLFDDIKKAVNTYFIGVGRSEPWADDSNPPEPVQSLSEERRFRSSLQSVKEIQDLSFVVPRIDWISGTTYQGWDDTTESTTSYVLTEERNVYLCVKQGNTESTTQPTGDSQHEFISTGDGYVWKYLYTISPLNNTKFLTASWMPVEYITALPDGEVDTRPALEQKQAMISSTAIKGQIANIVITNTEPYTTVPTITIEGDGMGATAIATVTNNVLAIELTAKGTGYNFAVVKISTGGATARAIISPPKGFGENPLTDLRARWIMASTSINGTEDDNFIIDNDYRQVCILKGGANEPTASALKYLTLSTNHNIQADTEIEFNTATKIRVDRVDGNNIYYHQNSETGYGLLNVGDTVTTGASIVSIQPADFNNFDGELLYIQNRSSVIRSGNQTDNIKLVIGV